jgi:hypothetical protein
MTRDLFGNDLPQTDAELVRAFVCEVRRQGCDCFNQFRRRHGIENVDRHIGVLVRVACERAGFVHAGSTSATLPASHGRLCQRWRDPEGGGA